MNQIRINFCGFWGSFKKEQNLFYSILSKHFKVEISDNPDFVICSNRGNPFEYVKYDCVRIMYMGENVSPDFTVFDYVIGFDYIDFFDRYFRLPFAFYSETGYPRIPSVLSEEEAWNLLKSKQYFCNFIYGHQSSHGMRENLFHALSSYKDVVSPGSFLNNTNNSKSRCSWAEKHEYVKKSKFTIAGDSISYPGFVTEKIVDPFIYHSIPVYYGNPLIDKDFNTKSFVWCKKPSDIQETVEQVEYLDNHANDYIEMLMQFPFVNDNYVSQLYQELESFLVNIFSQDPVNASRRVKYYSAESHEHYLKEYAKFYERTPAVIHTLKSKIRRE